MHRRVFLKAATIVVAGVVVPRIARGSTPRLRVTRHKIPWKLDRTMRIVHLTDVHVGWTTPKRVLDDAIAVAHRLRPTLVALTGDYVNHSLTHVDKVTTPLLIQHGEVDPRVPISNAWKFYRALKAMDKTVELEIYPRGGHALREPMQQREQMRRNLAWFKRWIP